MQLRSIASIALTGLILAACDQSSTLAPADEEALALSLAAEAQQTLDADQVSLQRLVQRLIRAVRERGDETAQAMLDEARQLHLAARAAREEGDLETARRLAHQAYALVLEAIVLTFPEAPARVGAAVDKVSDRIESRLGDRDAPRIRRVLARVAELRELADRALDEERPVEALAINLRAARFLVRLVHHLRHGMHDGEPAMAVLDVDLGG